MANQNLFVGLEIDGDPSHPDLKGLDDGPYKDGGHTYLMPAIVGTSYPTERKSGTVWLRSGYDEAYLYFPSGNWKEITLPSSITCEYLHVTSSGFLCDAPAEFTNDTTFADVWVDGSTVLYGTLYVGGHATMASISATGNISTTGAISGGSLYTTGTCISVGRNAAQYYTAGVIGYVSPIAYSFNGYASSGMFLHPTTDSNGGGIGLVANSVPFLVGCPMNNISPMLSRLWYSDFTYSIPFTYWQNSGYTTVYKQIGRYYAYNTVANRKVSFMWFLADANLTNYPRLDLWYMNETTLSQQRVISFYDRRTDLSVPNGLFLYGLSSGSGGYSLIIDPSTAQIYYVSSSERYKSNIVSVPIEKSSQILEIPVREYTRISNNRVETSLIAEEIYNCLPEAVAMKDGLPDGFNWDDINPHMLNLIQDLWKRVTELEKKLT